MAEDIASLGIKVDAGQVENAAKSLDKLSDSGKKSGAAALVAETSWGRYAASLANPVTATLALGAAVAALGTKAILSAEDARISVAKMELIYKNSGKNIGVSLKEIENQIQGLAQTTIFDDDSLRDASREFVKFGNITGDTLKSVIKTATEYATVTGQDVVSAAHAMARALADPEAASRLLKEAGVALTNTEQEYIKMLIDSNRESEAQAILADKLANAYDGASQALTGLHSEAEMTKNAIGELFEAMGNSAVAQAGLAALESSLQFIRGLVISTTNALNGASQGSGASGSWGGGASGSWGDPVGASQKSEAQMKKEIDAYKALGKASSGHHAAKAKTISDEQKAMNSLNSEFKSMVENMEKELAIGLLSGDDAKIAALDYDLETGSLRKLDEARKNHLRTLQLDIINRETEKKGNETKAEELAALTDEYNKLTLSARDYYSLTLTTKGVAPDQQGALLGQFDKNAIAENQKQKTDAANESLKSYIDNLDKAKSSMGDLGAVTSAVFDGALGGISTLAGAFTSMIDQINANTEALKANQEQMATASKSPIANYQAIAKLNKERTDLEKNYNNVALTGVRQMAGATGAMFKENTQARKAFHAVEMGLGAIEIAQQIKQLIPLASAAILTQGKGDPYSAFFRIAAMTAIVGGIVAAAGGSFSGGGSSVSASQTGTGTVLGDDKAVSESSSKTYQLLKDIHAEEYAELRGINDGVAKLNGDIVDTVTKVFQSGGINAAAIGGLGKKSNDPLQLPDPLGLGKFVFGSTKKEITEVGIQIGQTALKKVLDGKEINAQQFTTVQTTKTGFFGMGKSVTTSDTFSPLDKGVKSGLTSVFKSIGETMQELSKTLGGDVRKYVVPAMKIDIKGLNAEDASKKISGVISASMDKAALKIFGKTLKQYQELGEGLFETAVRVVAQVAVVRDAVGKSGLNIESNAIGIANALVKAAGGLQEFQKQFAVYFDKFYTDAEKQAETQKQLAGQLGAVGLALPATRDGYRKLVEAQDLNTKAGQSHYSMLIKLAGAADTYYSSLVDNQKKALETSLSAITAIIDALRNGSKTLLQSLTGLRQERSQAKGFLLGQLGLLNSGQGASLDANGISGAIGSLTKPSEKLFSTVLDFQRETVRTSTLFETFADRAEAQKTIWQQQLDALNGIRVEVAAQRAAADETARTSRKVADLLTRVTRDGDALLTVAA